MTGRTDGETLFHRILPANGGGLTSTTAVDWHLKVKDIEHIVGLTKNCLITVRMQKISLIHTFIQQILESHELNDRAHSDHTHPKISEITFSFPKFAPACKKSVHSICSFLRYSQF